MFLWPDTQLSKAKGIYRIILDQQDINCAKIGLSQKIFNVFSLVTLDDQEENLLMRFLEDRELMVWLV